MAKVAGELLSDLDKETVEMLPNYDGSLQEPRVLPSRVPNLLVNGSAGIAVGMATSIPPHNLGEVIGALLALIGNPDIGIDELMEHVPGARLPHRRHPLRARRGAGRRTARAAGASRSARGPSSRRRRRGTGSRSSSPRSRTR